MTGELLYLSWLVVLVLSVASGYLGVFNLSGRKRK